MMLLKGLGVTLLMLALFFTALGVVAAQQMVTVQINPIADSGVSGTATLTARDNATAVSLEARGYPPNTVHPTHFHTGRCAQPGPPVINLPDLQADAQGVARASAEVNVPLASLMDGNHFVMTHEGPPPAIGANLACGDVPRMEFNSLPRAGELDRQWIALVLGGLGLGAMGASLLIERLRAALTP